MELEVARRLASGMAIIGMACARKRRSRRSVTSTCCHAWHGNAEGAAHQSFTNQMPSRRGLSGYPFLFRSLSLTSPPVWYPVTSKVRGILIVPCGICSGARPPKRFHANPFEEGAQLRHRPVSRLEAWQEDD